jgi:hypothetical protein
VTNKAAGKKGQRFIFDITKNGQYTMSRPLEAFQRQNDKWSPYTGYLNGTITKITQKAVLFRGQGKDGNTVLLALPIKEGYVGNTSVPRLQTMFANKRNKFSVNVRGGQCEMRSLNPLRHHSRGQRYQGKTTPVSRQIDRAWDITEPGSMDKPPSRAPNYRRISSSER